MGKSLNELRDEIYEWAKGKGWWDSDREFGTLIALCHSELSEALEEARTGEPIANTYYRHNYDPASEPMKSEDFTIHTISLPGGYIEDIRNPRVSGLDLEFVDTYEDGVPTGIDGIKPDQREMPFVRGVSVGKPEGVPSELADTIIRILDMCGYYGIDIERILNEKMEYNHTRAHRHGGKTM